MEHKLPADIDAQAAAEGWTATDIPASREAHAMGITRRASREAHTRDTASKNSGGFPLRQARESLPDGQRPGDDADGIEMITSWSAAELDELAAEVGRSHRRLDIQEAEIQSVNQSVRQNTSRIENMIAGLDTRCATLESTDRTVLEQLAQALARPSVERPWWQSKKLIGAMVALAITGLTAWQANPDPTVALLAMLGVVSVWLGGQTVVDRQAKVTEGKRADAAASVAASISPTPAAGAGIAQGFVSGMRPPTISDRRKFDLWGDPIKY